MFLETILKWLFGLVRFTQIVDDEPPPSGGRGGSRSGRQRGVAKRVQRSRSDDVFRDETGQYRLLLDIRRSEVEAALDRFGPQLVPSPVPGWIARNYFCLIPLKSSRDDRPPYIFGRVKSSHPRAGRVQDIEELEIYFPNRGGSLDLLRILRSDIDERRPIQSFCIAVAMYLSPSERAEISQEEKLLLDQGFSLVYERGYGTLLEFPRLDLTSWPWLNVIGSEWFASIPEDLQSQIRSGLEYLVNQNTIILNYHSSQSPPEIQKLNAQLGYKYGLSDTYLIEALGAAQLTYFVPVLFDKAIKQPQTYQETVSFLEIRLGLDPDLLTFEFLNAFRRDLARVLRVPSKDVFFLGYRPGSVELFTAINDISPMIPENIQDELQTYHLETVQPQAETLERLTFISCDLSDIEVGKAILYYLQPRNFNPWLQQESIEFGEHMPRAIRRALENSTASIFCFSKDSNGPRRFYIWEVTQALFRAENEFRDGIYLLPVRIGRCETPEEILEYKPLDWDEENSLEKLVRALTRGFERLKEAMKRTFE